MNLPDILKNAIEQETLHYKNEQLAEATQQLSHRYRDESLREHLLSKKQRLMETDLQRAAYILARMPATFQAVKAVLKEIVDRQNLSYYSVLDVGAGPGTVMWAVHEVCYGARELTMIEQDASLISLGKKLAANADSILIRHAKWEQADILKMNSFPKHDLVIVSYSLGEWPLNDRCVVLDKLWEASNKSLILIEPGTMAGFDAIKKARQYLLDKGAYMVAPCPHAMACPMPNNDWCHFSVRVERSRAHKNAKAGSLGYEDEKFSYVAVSKAAVDLPNARILRHPQKKSGHVSFELCTKSEGLAKQTISRKQGELYKTARDLEWGDSF